MRNKTFIALFAALTAVLLVVSGCSFDGPAARGLSAGKSGLVLSIDGAGADARTILPKTVYKYKIFDADEVLEYYVALEDYDDSDDDAVAPVYPTAVESGTVPAGTGFIEVAPGTYVVYVTAENNNKVFAEGTVGTYVAATDDDEACIDGAVEIDADPDVQAKVTVTLEAVTSADTKGIFSWDLSAFEAGTTTATIIIDTTVPTTLTLKSTPSTGEYAFIGSIELDVGQYALDFTFDTFKWSEALQVFGGFDSAYTPAFNKTGITSPETAGTLIDAVLKAIADDKLWDFVPKHFENLGVLGVTAANFDEVEVAIKAIKAETGYTAPTDVAALKGLVDAALVKWGTFAILEGIDTDDFDITDTGSVDTEIGALIANGSDDLVVNWVDFVAEDNVAVAITVGGYTFTVDLADPIPVNWFYLEDLTTSDTQADNPFGPVPSIENDGAAKKITFTANNQGVGFILRPEQIALLTKPGVDDNGQPVTLGNTVFITVNASASGAGDSFRCAMANVTTGADWNGSAASGNMAVAAINKLRLDPNAANQGKEDRYKYFLLQHRNATEVTVTINSIKIKYGN